MARFWTQPGRFSWLFILPLSAAAPVLCAQTKQNPPPTTPPASSQTAKPDTGPDTNPFPEAQSEAAAKAVDDANKAASSGPAADPSGPGAAPGASDNAEPSSSSRTRMKGVDLLGDNDSPTSDGAGHIIVDPKLGAKDVKVGQLYMAEGDYAGAYSRFREATQVAPGNSDAVFYLAEAARKTAHLDEAAANYKLYLNAEPKGKRAKDARKALVELAGK